MLTGCFKRLILELEVNTLFTNEDVLSVLPSSTTIISNPLKFSKTLFTLSNVLITFSSSLNMGMTTEIFMNLSLK